MNNRINTENLMGQLPNVLYNDETMNAFARVFSDELVLIVEETVQAIIFNRIDALPEPVLDILAYDLKVDWYDVNYPIAAKRNLIKDSVNVHRRLGTRYAVETALGDIFPGTEVAEWFEYGGEPFYFRIILDVTNPLVSIPIRLIERAILMYKSLRSHLEDEAIVYRSRIGIIIRTKSRHQVYHARRTGTYPYRRVIGHIGDENIIIQTYGASRGYVNPNAGTIQAGTYPVRSTLGNIGVEGIVIETSYGDANYSTPQSGTGAVGTHPTHTTMGHKEGDAIYINTHADEAEYATRAAGTYPGSSTSGHAGAENIVVATEGDEAAYVTRDAGTHPARATVADLDGGALNVTADGDVAGYNARHCGTPAENLLN